MTQRFIFRRVLAAVICLFALAATALAADQPNVVVIMSDDAGYNDFGFMADQHDYPTEMLTPNLDALAAQSVVMSNGYVCAGVCSPSRASFLAGLYGQRFGYEDNPSGQPGNTQGLPAGQTILPHRMQDLGYTTGLVGKWHLGETDGVNRPLDMGYDEFYGLFGGGRPHWAGYGDSQRAIRRGDVSIESTWGTEGDQSKYDPVNGRYLTDAFAEEAVDFINRHAGEEEPFFLHLAITAPHAPLQAKQSDLDMFPGITDTGRKTVAAMTYSLDRAVGDVMNALAANGVDDETIVVFFNDNGGTQNPPEHDNFPLYGFKGGMWEGGIRVPMLVKMPGVTPGVYDEPVQSIDFVPTLVNAAGGDADSFFTDGADLTPYLTGEETGSPRDVLFWRGADGRFAVRRGEWKLMKPSAAATVRLSNLTDAGDEPNTYHTSQPQVVTELIRELTYWESEMARPMWGPLGEDSFNESDHFTFRGDVGANWSTSGNWLAPAQPFTPITLMKQDGYANTVLEFGVPNSGDYVANNDMVRATSYTFMLNEIRFAGDYVGAGGDSVSITGKPVLLVNSLTGAPATIRNAATGNNQSAMEINIELQLLDELVIDGEGTQNLVVNGTIRDYWEPRGVTKRGPGRVVLAGQNLFTGDLVVEAGSVAVDNLAGGLTVTGGELQLELGSPLVIGGDAELGGTLKVSLAAGLVPEIGQGFTLLTASSRTGVFDTLSLPELEGIGWHVSYLGNGVELTATMVGDFNIDGSVDAADYVVWRKNDGTPAGFDLWRTHFGQTGDFNIDGSVDAADYVVWRKNDGTPAGFALWRTHFGQTAGNGSGANANATVPEPANFVLLMFAATGWGLRRGQGRAESPNNSSMRDTAHLTTVVTHDYEAVLISSCILIAR